MKVTVASIRQQLTLNFLWFCMNAQYGALAPIVIPTQLLLFVGGGEVGSVEQATYLGGLTRPSSPRCWAASS